MYSDLDAFLILALTERLNGVKAAYKKAVEMYRGKGNIEPKMAKGVIANCIKARDVKAFVGQFNQYVQDYLYYALPARDLAREGAQGMVIVGEEVWSIEVTYETEEDYWWSIENETEIYTAASFWLIWHYRLTQDFSGDFLMFNKYGYRGIPRWWGVKNIGGLVKYADLLYYPEEGDVLAETYTHNELAAQQAERRKSQSTLEHQTPANTDIGEGAREAISA